MARHLIGDVCGLSYWGSSSLIHADMYECQRYFIYIGLRVCEQFVKTIAAISTETDVTNLMVRNAIRLPPYVVTITMQKAHQQPMNARTGNVRGCDEPPEIETNNITTTVMIGVRPLLTFLFIVSHECRAYEIAKWELNKFILCHMSAFEQEYYQVCL